MAEIENNIFLAFKRKAKHQDTEHRRRQWQQVPFHATTDIEENRTICDDALGI